MAGGEVKRPTGRFYGPIVTIVYNLPNLHAVHGAASVGASIPYSPNRYTIPRRTTPSLFLTV